jgi:predicted small metal-binding protein
MALVIHCDCGTPVKGMTEDELVENAQDHAKNKHGVIVTWEQALGLAEREE